MECWWHMARPKGHARLSAKSSLATRATLGEPQSLSLYHIPIRDLLTLEVLRHGLSVRRLKFPRNQISSERINSDATILSYKAEGMRPIMPALHVL